MSTITKRFKLNPTSLEHLPNELLIETLAYLNGVDAVFAFSQLNYRFQCLLYYSKIFDFKLVSKAKFDFIVQQHDPKLWQSLCLSDDSDTPDQIAVFRQCFSFDKYLTQLHSLTLTNSKMADSYVLLSEISLFEHLVSLSIDKVCLCEKNIQSLKLPSLKKLIICTCQQSDWVQNFDRLETLEHKIEHEYEFGHHCHLAWPSSLKCLKVFYSDPFLSNFVRTSLRPLSQLISLSVYESTLEYTLPNGQLWQSLIVSSFSSLKKFQFCFEFKHYLLTRNDIDQSIATFSIPFYLEEKSWFVQCDYNLEYPYTGALFSVPFAFEHFKIRTSALNTSVSTLPLQNVTSKVAKRLSFTKVKTLTFEQKSALPTRSFTDNYITHLIINRPTFPIYGFDIKMFQLRHLSIGYCSGMSSNDFAHLLENAPSLCSLSIQNTDLKRLTNQWTNHIVCTQLSTKIKTLNLTKTLIHLRLREACITISQLRFIIQIFSNNCQHLSISLLSKKVGTNLILKNMKQLRSLNASIEGVRESKNLTQEWLDTLRRRLSESDHVQLVDSKHFSIWFGNRP